MMLQLPNTAAAEFSAVLPETDVLPSDIPSLVAMFRAANAVVTAAVGKSETVMNAATDRAEPIYRALLTANARSPREEATRLTCIADYCKELGLGSDLEGNFEAPDLYRIAKGLTKLTAPVGPAALKVIDKNVQPLSRYPAPSLAAELAQLERDNDVVGMIALYDYFVSLAGTSEAFANTPRGIAIDDFLSAECNHNWSRAYAVADRLKRLKPTSHQRDCHAHTLINAALAMGGNLQDVTAIAQHLSEAHE